MGAGLIDDFIRYILSLPYCAHAILSIPFCPMPFCPYTILSVPFCPLPFCPRTHQCPRVEPSLSACICAPCTTIARDANNCATRNNQSHHDCLTSLRRSSLVGLCTRKRRVERFISKTMRMGYLPEEFPDVSELV